MKADFADWLQNELNKRGWTQGDLVYQIKAAGGKSSNAQMSYILNRKRKATGENCIAIAGGLGVSREEVFRARGWLLPQPEDPYGPQIDLRAEKLAKKVSLLAFENREITLDAMEAMLESAYKLTLKIKASSSNGHENQN